jgi:hypothetical protein
MDADGPVDIRALPLTDQDGKATSLQAGASALVLLTRLQRTMRPSMRSTVDA